MIVERLVEHFPNLKLGQLTEFLSMAKDSLKEYKGECISVKIEVTKEKKTVDLRGHKVRKETKTMNQLKECCTKKDI